MPGLRCRRGRPWPPARLPPRHSLFRPPSAPALGQATLALPGPGVSQDHVHRGTPTGRAPGRNSPPCNGLADRRAGPVGHLNLGLGPPARRLLAHPLGRHPGRGPQMHRKHRPADRRERARRRRACWSHTGPPGTGMVVGIVDHSSDANGCPCHGSSTSYRDGPARPTLTGLGRAARNSPLVSRPLRWTRTTAMRTRSATNSPTPSPSRTRSTSSNSDPQVDEVRRRVQQETLGDRGRKGDPLYGIRPPLQIGAEHLTTNRPRDSMPSSPPGTPSKSSATSTTPARNGVENLSPT